MNLPCSVIQDLLPLYTENLASEESMNLVKDHLADCVACREYLDGLQQPMEPIPESVAPIKQIKKELKKRRWRTAAIAALSVFLILFALLARITHENPIPYSPALLSVDGAVPYDPTEETLYSGAVHMDSPDGWQTANPGQALIINRNEHVSGSAAEVYLDDETGELTVCLQYFSTQAALVIDDVDGSFSIEHYDTKGSKDIFYPLPDRVIYGFGQEQTLLWGEPMNGGVQILPRLVLAYYALIAIGFAAILAVLWIVFRKKSFSPVIRQLCFVPVAYLLGQLFIKGTETLSVFLMRDLSLICIEATAFYVLLTLSYHVWSQHKKDNE